VRPDFYVAFTAADESGLRNAFDTVMSAAGLSAGASV